MSGNDKSTMSNHEIKTSLISIYDKINKPPTKEVGYDLFLKLVHRNLDSSAQMNFIINHIGEFISPLTPKEKDPCIKLLSLIFYSPESDEDSFDTKIYYPFLSPVLSILQNLIKDTNSSIFPTISNIFAEIVQNIMPTDIEASNIDLEPDEKTAYEMLQGFCIYNMKYDDKSNRIVGSLCLTKLVENCPIVLQRQYMKLIWEVIISLIDKKNFNAKYELLNCLISLILGAENLFTPYAHNTLYKVLDFLADTDWLKRKLALNVIYTLIFYCKEEILPLREHIISFLRALKTDKVKEVREVCLLILKIFSENEQKTKEPKTKSSNLKNDKKKIASKTNESSKAKMNKPSSNKTKDKTPTKKNLNRGSKNLDFDKNYSNSNKFSECVVPEPQENKDMKDREESITEDNSNKNRAINAPNNNTNTSLEQDTNLSNNLNSSNNNNSLKKMGLSSTSKILNEHRNSNKDNNDITAISQTKFVNRKDDKTFINEKMVIKPDPNKSIFKSNPNPAFFNQANNKKSQDIVVVSKGEPPKFSNIDIVSNVNKIEENEDAKPNLKPPKVVNKKEPSRKELSFQRKDNNNEPEIQEKNEKKEEIKTNKIEPETINSNETPESSKANIVKEKVVQQPPVKNKAGPIVRNKKIKKIQDKEDQPNYEKEEKKKNTEENKHKPGSSHKKIINKKEDYDEEADDYKSYLNKNEKKKGKIKRDNEKEKENLKEKENENETYDANIINTLLSQMNSLSEKQLSLIDVMDNIQMETQGHIKELNKRITKLERTIEDLNNELYYIKNDN